MYSLLQTRFLNGLFFLLVGTVALRIHSLPVSTDQCSTQGWQRKHAGTQTERSFQPEAQVEGASA